MSLFTQWVQQPLEDLPLLQMLVFVEKDAKTREYLLRRVRVTRPFKDVVSVPGKLTKEDQEFSRTEIAKGRRSIQPLFAGERAVTTCVGEMTAALEILLRKQ